MLGFRGYTFFNTFSDYYFYHNNHDYNNYNNNLNSSNDDFIRAMRMYWQGKSWNKDRIPLNKTFPMIFSPKSVWKTDQKASSLKKIIRKSLPKYQFLEAYLSWQHWIPRPSSVKSCE